MGEVVTISVASIDSAKDRLAAALRGEAQGNHISFLTTELIWKTLAPKRMAIVRALTGAGPIAIRELARRIDRDVKAVHGDVQTLIKAGIIDRTDDGKILFPYDAIHVDFMLTKAA